MEGSLNLDLGLLPPIVDLRLHPKAEVDQSTSPASSRGSSTSHNSSRSSSRTSRGRSRGVLKQNKSLGGLKKSVKFESRVPKNGGPTTSLQRGKGKRRGPGRGNR